MSRVLADCAQEFLQVSAYRQMPPEQIVHDMGAFTRKQFEDAWHREGGVMPVVIPSHNEMQDLPATLWAIARTGGLAIVVSNNSTDETMQFAREMGAVAFEANKGRKMVATQAGLQYVVGELGLRHMLFTDADTLPQRTWVEAMEAAMHQRHSALGAIACGESLVWHGNPLADLIVNYGSIRNAIVRSKANVPPGKALGHNYGLSLDDNGQVEAAVMSLPADLFVKPGEPADDFRIAKAVKAAGALQYGVLDPQAWVLTRGDRITEVRQAIDLTFRGKSYRTVTATSYRRQYGRQ